MERLRGGWGIRREFREVLEARWRKEGHADKMKWNVIRRGWRIGAEDFPERLVEKGAAEKADSKIHAGVAVGETTEEKAQGESVEDSVGGGVEETHDAADGVDRGGIECRIAWQRMEHAREGAEWDAVKGMQRA